MAEGERIFDFMDSSSWNSSRVYREVVEGWLNGHLSDEKSVLVSRLKKGSDDEFYAALAEIVVHEALRRRVSKIRSHPSLSNTLNRPDFELISSDGSTMAYVEVTSYGKDRKKVGKSAQAAKIYNAINDMRLPAGHCFGYTLFAEGDASPPLKPLVREIRAWVDAFPEGDELAEKVFVADDWKIKLALHRIDTDKVFERAICVHSGGARWISPSDDLRGALQRKSSRYGSMGAPYLIAVSDRKGEMTWGNGIHDEVVQALFGDICYRWTPNQVDGTWVRQKDGFFGSPNEPRRQHVSAVLVLPQPDIWGLRNANHQPMLVHNPWAKYPLPAEVLPIQGTRHIGSADFERTEGIFLADILGLPEIWPPENNDL